MDSSEFWKGKRVFLTGHTGFKGSWLALWLSEMGALVSGYSLKPPTSPSLFELARVQERCLHHAEADICDPKELSRALQESEPEVVFHFAAQSLVQLSYHEPVETYRTNVYGTAQLLNLLRQIPSVRSVVVATSDKCYENQELDRGYVESDPLGGFDPYSNSKACAELVVQSFRNSFFPLEEYSKHQVALASARAGNVIGGGDWSENRLVPDCIRAYLSGETVTLRNPSAVRPWQHVLEPLHGYITLARKLYSDGTSFTGGWNFGPADEGVRTVQSIAQILANGWFGPASLTEASDQQGGHETTCLKLNSQKAKEQLQWEPRWNLEKALQMIIDWTKVFAEEGDLQKKSIAQIYEYDSSK